MHFPAIPAIDILGKDKEWEAEIIEQVPDQVIAWRGEVHAGEEQTGGASGKEPRH